jgi:hypothetical protein
MVLNYASGEAMSLIRRIFSGIASIKDDAYKTFNVDIAMEATKTQEGPTQLMRRRKS